MDGIELVEEPLVGIDADTADLLLKWMGELDLDDPEEIGKLQALQEGLTQFVAAARELEAKAVEG